MEWILEYMGRVRTLTPQRPPLPLLLRRPRPRPVPLLLLLQAGGKGPPLCKHNGSGDDGADREKGTGRRR